MATPSTFGAFLNQIGRYPLLTAEQEITLGNQIQAWLALRDKENPTADERRTIRAGERARRKMYLCNLRLCVSVAKKSFGLVSKTPGGMDMDDVLQEACLGLESAVLKFDPSRGYKFSTYAYWWIRQGIGRALDASGHTVKLPIGWRNDMRKIAIASTEFAQQHRRRPTFEELAAIVDFTPEKVESFVRIGNSVSSLDAKTKTSDDDGTNLVDLIASDDNVDTTDLERAMRWAVVEGALKQLDPREDDLIRRVHGLAPYHEPQPLHQIAKDYDLSRETIRQSAQKAFMRLRFIIGTANTLQGELL